MQKLSALPRPKKKVIITKPFTKRNSKDVFAAHLICSNIIWCYGK